MQPSVRTPSLYSSWDGLLISIALSVWCSISTVSAPSSSCSPSRCSATASLLIFCSQLDRSTLKTRSNILNKCEYAKSHVYRDNWRRFLWLCYEYARLEVDRHPPFPAVISWQAFRISKGPPAWLQSAFFLILFFWSTTSQQTDRWLFSMQQESVGLFWWCCTKKNSLSGRFITISMSVYCYLFHPLPDHFLPACYSPSPHLCCRAVQGGRWNRLFAGGGTGRPCSVSRRSPLGEDTGRLCSTPGSPASEYLLWCSGTGLEGTAAPGWFKWGCPLLKQQ